MMVLEETAKKVGFLKYLGAFGVQKNAKSLVESLEFAGQLLDNPDNLVLIFPQGKLFSGNIKTINFEKGISKIIQASTKKFDYIFAAILIDYFAKRKASIRVYLENWEAPAYTSLQVLKNAYNKHYESALRQQSEMEI